MSLHDTPLIRTCIILYVNIYYIYDAMSIIIYYAYDITLYYYAYDITLY